MNNYFKQLTDEQFAGLKVILGSYTIHLLEGETSAIKKVMKALSQSMLSAHPFYSSAWVLHFVDESPTKIFNQ